MTYKCEIELVGGQNQCQELLQEHGIVTVVVSNKGKEIDRFNATVHDLLESGFIGPASEKTAYLRLKSHLATVLQ